MASDPAEESNVYQQITTQGHVHRYRGQEQAGLPDPLSGPFDWFDWPPRAFARIIGVRWLGNLLYPDLHA